MFDSNPKYISPTDKMMTPVSQKLSAAKKKHFTKYVPTFCCALCGRADRRRRGAKPMQSLFAQPPKETAPSDEDSASDGDAPTSSLTEEKKDEDENPF